MTDIRTVKHVTIDDQFRVVVAEDGEVYEAAVVGMRCDPMQAAMQQALSLGQVEDPEWMSFRDSPRAKHEKKWVAIGGAVERFLDQAKEEEPEGTEVPIDG